MLHYHFAAAKHPMKWGFGCEIGSFLCFAAVSQLRNEGHCAAKWHSCAKSGFAAAKSSAKWSFPCKNRIFHALVVRNRFTAAKWESLCCEMALMCQKWFRREGPEAANWFCSKVLISQRLRNLADPCFSPVLTRFCSERLPFNFFAIPPDFDHPKTYITSKQTRIKAFEIKIKAFKSKFKH